MNRILFIGAHLSHSLLPLVYQLIAEELKINIEVINHEIQPHEIKDLINDNVVSRSLFCCVTFPYKIVVGNLVDTKACKAEKCQSVNIVYWDKEKGIVGDNTDGRGFANDLRNRLKVNIANEEVLILGNGGVSNGIIPELQSNHSKKIVICDRNYTNSVEQKLIMDEEQNISFCSYNDIPEKNYKLVVNATSASIYNQIPPFPIKDEYKNAFFYECAYSKDDQTSFEQYLRDNQISNYSSGVGMLIEQAAVAIESILKISVDTAKIFDKLQIKINPDLLVS